MCVFKTNYKKNKKKNFYKLEFFFCILLCTSFCLIWKYNHFLKVRKKYSIIFQYILDDILYVFKKYISLINSINMVRISDICNIDFEKIYIKTVHIKIWC